MIVCKVCGNPVSRNAKACPKCGHPPPIAAFSNSCLGMALGMIAVMVILGIIAVWMKSAGLLP